MSAAKLIGIVLIVAGILGLAYGSFSYTKETHDAKLGPINLSVKEKETVNVPAWAGVAAIAAGAAPLRFGFVSGVTLPSGAVAGVITQGIDNWSVTVWKR